MGSDFIFVEDHVGNSIDDGVFPFAVGTNQFALHDVGLDKK
jgi:hypothetical protein